MSARAIVANSNAGNSVERGGCVSIAARLHRPAVYVGLEQPFFLLGGGLDDQAAADRLRMSLNMVSTQTCASASGTSSVLRRTIHLVHIVAHLLQHLERLRIRARSADQDRHHLVEERL